MIFKEFDNIYVSLSGGKDSGVLLNLCMIAAAWWGAPLLAGLAFIAVGPAILAYRFWGVGVQRAGPVLGGFFINLTPLFAALMSAAFLGERPQLYHALAFALIVAGIVVTSRRS